jgi:hypothetical protein
MRVQLTEAELMNLRGDLLQGEDSRAQLEQLRHELGTDVTCKTPSVREIIVLHVKLKSVDSF